MFIIILVSATVAALFAIAWLYTRGVVVLVAVALWLVFPLYNYWVLANCSGDCAIRVDLLLVLPLLFVVSVLALLSIVRTAWRKRKVSRAGN